MKPVTDVDDAVAIQVKVVPATFESKLTFAEVAPEQMVCDIGALITCGIGFTVTIWLAVGPVHPENEGVTL